MNCQNPGHENRIPLGKISWGPSDSQESAFLCPECVDRLWESCRDEVMQGKSHFRLEDPTPIRVFKADWIATRAFFRWIEAGCPSDDQWRHWFYAEQDWHHEQQKHEESP